MKKEKFCSLTIEFSDEEYSMLSKAAAEHGYGSVKEFAEQVITQMYKGGGDEADANHSA
ncbi:MAG: hypothetical protein LBG42_03205 [Treponema sp.]|jgi:hypothetical protein|nr:hypothetical protein [Treponema sp.]